MKNKQSLKRYISYDRYSICVSFKYNLIYFSTLLFTYYFIKRILREFIVDYLY